MDFLLNMGFIDIEVSQIDSSNRYVVAKWNGESGADPNYFPSEISDIHEI